MGAGSGCEAFAEGDPGSGLAYLEEHQESFLTEASWTPFTEEEIDWIEGQARDMGEWSARDHDEILYGSKA